MNPPERLQPGASISSARRVLSQALRHGDIDTADVEARLLLQIALGLDHTGLIRYADRALNESERNVLEGFVARRLAGEPIARIAGVREFWGLSLQLGPATLVPRPETETVVEAALDWVLSRGPAHEQSLQIADLGTGSGALLLALLSELPHARGVGTDLSSEAALGAAANAAQLGFRDRAAFVNCHFGCALRGGFDLVVSNPPYIATGEIKSLALEVRDHDPLLALDGGEDGFAAYREIAQDAGRLLRPGGVIIVELGAGQAPAVADIFRAERLTVKTPVRRDLGGIPRALAASRG